MNRATESLWAIQAAWDDEAARAVAARQIDQIRAHHRAAARLNGLFARGETRLVTLALAALALLLVLA